MIARSDVVNESREWLGTPFVHQARLKGIGCDCIGLVGGVGVALGLPSAIAWLNDHRFMGYGETPNPGPLLDACFEYFLTVPVESVVAGDVLLFRFQRDPQHFGIVTRTAPLYVIHAYRPNGHVVENRVDVTWRRRIVKAFRYLEMERF